MRARTPTVTLVHEFSGTDGAFPVSNLIELPNGKFLGVTWNAKASPASGVIYTIDAAGHFASVAQLSGTTQCATPAEYRNGSGIFQASSGNIYGVCYSGGENNLGSIYMLSRTGSATLLYSFDGSLGAHPVGPLVEGIDGNLYGVTSSTVYKMTPSGVVTLLYSFGSGGPVRRRAA